MAEAGDWAKRAVEEANIVRIAAETESAVRHITNLYQSGTDVGGESCQDPRVAAESGAKMEDTAP